MANHYLHTPYILFLRGGVIALALEKRPPITCKETLTHYHQFIMRTLSWYMKLYERPEDRLRYGEMNFTAVPCCCDAALRQTCGAIAFGSHISINLACFFSLAARFRAKSPSMQQTLGRVGQDVTGLD